MMAFLRKLGHAVVRDAIGDVVLFGAEINEVLAGIRSEYGASVGHEHAHDGSI